MTGELQVVERSLEPTSCAYCDRPRNGTCPACSRATCAAHRPSPAHIFCFQCDAEWSRGESRRGIVGIVVMVVAAALAMILGMAIGAIAGSVGLGSLGALVLPLPTAAATHIGLERYFRRTFRPTGALPPATLRD